MKHNLLGKIQISDGNPFDAVAMIRHDSRDIEVGICRDDQILETTLNLAAKVVEQIADLDVLAKRIAVKNLLKAYNTGWNEYDEVQEDGSLLTFSNPVLTEAEFEAKLSLDGINVTGESVINFYYENQGMFWGHSVMVGSFDGIDFSNATAELVG